MSAGTFAPAPGRAPTRSILAHQIRMELTLTARRGEAVVLAMGVPLLVLLGAGLTHATNVPGDDRLGFVVPGVLALTVMSTAFTGQAITTGYERSYGVLKRLGASPLTRPGPALRQDRGGPRPDRAAVAGARRGRRGGRLAAAPRRAAARRSG